MLLGEWFPSQLSLWCKFTLNEVERVYMPASVASSSLLRCRTPRVYSRLISQVDVSFDEYGVGDGRLAYSYTNDAPAIYALSPRSGPHRGGTLVQVQGKGFQRTASLTCIFGNESVAGIYISDMLVGCVTPSGQGTVLISVVNFRWGNLHAYEA